MATRLLTVLLLTTSLIGCRGSGGDDDDDDDNTGADGGAAAVSIYDVQDGTLAKGDAVTLSGVVVTAIDNYGDRVGSFWVAETADHPTHGRAYSGVQVFTTDISQVSSLVVGDLVDIGNAEVDEFAINCDQPDVDCADTTQTLTELKGAGGGTMTITKVGDGTVPAAVVVAATDLAIPAEAEKWEGVLIQVVDVAVTSAPRQVTADTTLYEMRVTGPFIVQSALAALGDRTRDDCLTSVTGILDYFFDYKLQPRTTDEISAAADTSGCLYETSAADCADDVDNDHDGFADCGDFSCVDANPDLCTSDGTVINIQNGTIAENTRISLTGVVVTAIASDGRIWVQDAGGAADYNGIQVYRGTSAPALDAQIVVGAVVDVTGTVTEFETPFDSPTSSETEIEVDTATEDVTFVSAGSAPAVRSDAGVGALAADPGGEPYEGMLVELSNVKVSVMDAMHGEFIITDGTDTLHVGDLIFSYSLPAMDTCFATLRGVMGETFGDRKLQPRSADDMVTGGTCP